MSRSAGFDQDNRSNQEADDATLAQIVAEIGERLEQRESVDKTAYLRRYPEYAERLSSLWPVLLAAAEIGDLDPVDPQPRYLLGTEPDDAPQDAMSRLGDFQLIREIGRGGMGIVYEAYQTSLRRRVALKVLTAAAAMDPRQLQRFEVESHAAAALHHPNIVAVHSVGCERSMRFYTMDLIDGQSLAEAIAELRGNVGAASVESGLNQEAIGSSAVLLVLSAEKQSSDQPAPASGSARESSSAAQTRSHCRAAAILGVQAARALEHAHQNGVLHRDIKPSNLLIDRGGNLWVADFGLARIQGDSQLTQTGDLVGTLRYMSPEQALGRRDLIDQRADIYALGSTLYELLTLRLPFPGDNREELLDRIAHQEPLAPRRLNPLIPLDLQTIVLKAMAKEPARRYASAAALRDDLERFLDNRPILGRPVSAWERARRWARRRPAVAALMALIVLMACGLLGGIVAWLSWLGWHNRQLDIQVARADRETRDARAQRLLAEERRHQADRHHNAESLRRARRALDARQFELGQDILHDVHPEAGGYDRRDFAWRYLWRQAHRDFSQLWGHEATVAAWAFSANGKLLATRDLQGKVLIWDLASTEVFDKPRTIMSLSHSEGHPVCFSPDGQLIAALDGGPLGLGIHVADLASGGPVTRLNCAWLSWFGAVQFDDKSRRLALYGGRPGSESVSSWNLTGGDRSPHSWLIEGGPTHCEVPVSGGFLVAGSGGRTRVLDIWTGALRVELAGPDSYTWSTDLLSSFSADTRIFAGYTDKNHIALWDTASGRELARCEVLEDACRIALSPAGSRLAMLNRHGRLVVFDRATGRFRVLSSGSERLLKDHSLSFSCDEALLVICTETQGGGPQPPEVWEIATATRVAVFPGRILSAYVAFLPFGRTLILMGGTRPRIWRLDPPSDPDALSGHTAEAWAAAFSLDGKVLATGSDDTRERQTIKLWHTTSGQLLAGWKGHTATVAALAFSPDGRVLASGSLDSGKPGNSNVILWDVASHRRQANLEGHTGPVRSVAFSPDGRQLATASDDLTARLWDVAEKKTRAVLAGHTKNLTCVAFSPDGSMLASASNDMTVRLWDVATGRAGATLHDVGNVNAVAFAPDGSLLASTNEDGSIKLWDPANGNLVRTIRGEAEQLRCVAFTPDGRNVVAAGKGKVIRIWDVATGQELLTLEGHKAQINALAFSPDGSILASSSHDGAVRLWRAGPIDPLGTGTN